MPEIGGKTKTLTHSNICKYFLSGAKSCPHFTTRLRLLPVTAGHSCPMLAQAGHAALGPLPPERLAALLQLGLHVGIVQGLEVQKQLLEVLSSQC